MGDYQKSIKVNKPVAEVYSAITRHIADWWSNDLKGSAAKTGDVFNIAFNKTRKTFIIVLAKPDEEVIWNCTEAYIDKASLTNKAEWVNTKIHWLLNSTDKGTTLQFSHEGLNKNLECYDICESGWNTFLSSLESYISTGKGKPFLKAETKGVKAIS